MKKIKIVSLLLFVAQTACFAYTTSYTTLNSPFLTQRLYRRGFMTGIPAPIVQYNIPAPPEPYYINRSRIKNKYRYYYPQTNNSSFSVISY